MVVRIRSAIVLSILALLVGSGATLAQQLRPGEVVPKVVCAASSAHSYALYLPKAYTPERRWPVLYAFDARADGLYPLRLFQEAAEELGFIIASSNDTQSDVDIDPSLKAVSAMLADTHARLALDDRRIYLTGFSGGARMATLLGLKSKLPVAGVIGCAGGFLQGFPPVKSLSFAWFGTVGDQDFNYVEMKRLDRTLGALGARHALAIFPGPHQWAPKDIATEGLEFLALDEMRSGRTPSDPERLATLVARARARAHAADEAGHPLEALHRYERLARELDGLADLGPDRQRLAALRVSKEIQASEKENEILDERDFRLMGRIESSLQAALAGNDPTPPKKLYADLDIPTQKARLENGRTEAEKASARRILLALFVRTSAYLASEFRAANDPARASFVLTIATEIRPRDPIALYNLACARAVQGEKTKALEALKRALDAGLEPRTQIDSDPDLAPLRDLPAFRVLVGP